MVVAYILIMTRANSEKKVAEALRASKPVKNVNIVYGEYDIIARVEVADMKELNEFLLNTVRPLQGVENTSTLIAAY